MPLWTIFLKDVFIADRKLGETHKNLMPNQIFDFRVKFKHGLGEKWCTGCTWVENVLFCLNKGRRDGIFTSHGH